MIAAYHFELARPATEKRNQWALLPAIPKPAKPLVFDGDLSDPEGPERSSSGSCKGTFPYDSDLHPPPGSSDVYTHFTIISSFIYLLLVTFFSDISDLRRCRGTYSIPLILIPYCTIPILHDSITFSDLP